VNRRSVAVVCSLFLAAAAPAAECPPIWISQSALTIYGPQDPNSPPNQTTLPDSPSQFGYVPAAAIHVVALANGQEALIDTKAWCDDIAADTLANEAERTNANVISRATGSFEDGRVAMVEQSSTSGGGAAAQSSALVQMGLRDILRANAGGSDLVPITLRRRIQGSWTLDGGEGAVLDRFIGRSFVLTIWERTQPTGPQSWTRRLVIDDHDLDGFLNGEETYEFEVLPGKDLILSLNAHAQAGCQGDLTFGDPPAQYADCYAFMDFGGTFGEPIEFTFEPGAGVTLTSEGGFTQFVPEADGAAPAEIAGLVLAFLARRRA